MGMMEQCMKAMSVSAMAVILLVAAFLLCSSGSWA